MYNSILVALYCILFSCASNYSDPNSQRVIHNDSTITFQPLTIRGDSSLILSSGSKIISFAIQGDSTFCFFQDCSSNYIRAYNVQSFHFSYKLPAPTQINLCQNLCNYHIIDSTHYNLLTGQGEIYAYKDGKIELIADLKNIKLKSKYEYFSWLLDHNQIFMRSDSSLLIPIAFEGKVKSKRLEKRPFTSALIKDGKVNFIGDRSVPHWSEIYYGLIDKTYQYFTDSTIVYMFSQSPEIREYNYKTNQLKIKQSKSYYQNAEIKPVPKNNDRDHLWQHLKENGRYEKLIFDPWKQCYYRFFLHPIPSILSDGRPSTMQDRQISIMVLDKDFNPIAEKMLPSQATSIHMAIPTASGLVINLGPLENVKEKGLNLLNVFYDANN